MTNHKQIAQNDIRKRKIWGGTKDNIQAYKNVGVLGWLIEVIETQFKNMWLPDVIKDLMESRIHFRDLDEQTKLAFKRTLARVTNADWIQMNKLVHEIMPLVTDNALKIALQQQAFSELIHTESYLRIAEVCLDDPTEVDLMYLTDPVLRDLQDKLQFRSLSLNPAACPKEFAKLLATNVILEGLLFYVNFYFFYKLGRDTGKFNGVVSNIRYINKDEDVHNTMLFVPAFHTHLAQHYLEVGDIQEEVFALFEDATKYESLWAKSLDPDNKELEDFVKHRASICLKMLGYEVNPYREYLDKYPRWFYDEMGGGVKLERQASWFQSTVTNYEHYNITEDDISNTLSKYAVA